MKFKIGDSVEIKKGVTLNQLRYYLFGSKTWLTPEALQDQEDKTLIALENQGKVTATCRKYIEVKFNDALSMSISTQLCVLRKFA